MYLYLYDSFLNNKKYSSLLAKIETRLTDLEIGGKIFRLSPLRNIQELLNDEVRAGAKTIIVVGNDKTFTQVINVTAKLNIILGLIPVGPENKIAQILGISSFEEAGNIIAARIIHKVDLGKINDTYFISGITISSGRVVIDCDKYRVTPQSKNQIGIYNLRPFFALGWGQVNCFNPQDGMLEILIQPKTSVWQQLFKKPGQLKNSIIPAKNITIRSRDSVSIITDGQKVLKTPVKIEVAAKKLKLIVGKNRLFWNLIKNMGLLNILAKEVNKFV